MNRKQTIFYERYAAGDFSNKQMEVYDKGLTEDDKKIIESIREENSAIRKTCSMDIYKHRILKKAEIRSKVARLKVNNYLRISIPVAACLIICLFAATLFFKPAGFLQAKGTAPPSFSVYRKTPEGREKMNNFTYVDKGDRLQIMYKPAAEKYGFVFSIDGRKTITYIYPAPEPGQPADEITEPFRLEKGAGGQVPVPNSYILDDAPDCEVIFFVTSAKKFNLKEKVEQVLKSYSFNSSNFFPAGEMEFIILLKKEGKNGKSN